MPFYRVPNTFTITYLLATLFFAATANAGDTEISGLLETKIRAGKNTSGIKSSDIMQAMVELEIDSDINDWVSTHVFVLYENNGTIPLNIDEATIKFSRALSSSFSLRIGQQYLPFGFFESNMISMPMTQLIGEIRQPSLLLSYNNNFSASLYLFSGELVKIDSEKHLNKIGFNLGYTYLGDNLLIDVGAGYISSIGDSNRLSNTIKKNPLSQDNIIGVGSNGILENYISGIASHILIIAGPVTIIIDHVFSTEEFISPEVRAGNAAKPSALNIELGVDMSKYSIIAIGVQQSVDAQDLGLPKIRALLTYSHAINNNTDVALEFSYDNEFLFGNGEQGRPTTGFILQLRAKF